MTLARAFSSENFFSPYSCPLTFICGGDARWHSFLTVHAGVIEDGSLSCHNPIENPHVIIAAVGIFVLDVLREGNG